MKSLEDLGLVRGQDFDHMNGLTQNHRLIKMDMKDIVTVREAFKEYCRKARTVFPLTEYWDNELQKGSEC
jgi:hypothetical protein